MKPKVLAQAASFAPQLLFSDNLTNSLALLSLDLGAWGFAKVYMSC